MTRLVAEAKKKLEPGVDLCRRIRRAGGAVSDDSEIMEKLKARGYSIEERRAILRAKSPNGAAIQLVSDRINRKPATVRSALRRATKT